MKRRSLSLAVVLGLFVLKSTALAQVTSVDKDFIAALDGARYVHAEIHSIDIHGNTLFFQTFNVEHGMWVGGAGRGMVAQVRDRKFEFPSACEPFYHGFMPLSGYISDDGKSIIGTDCEGREWNYHRIK